MNVLEASYEETKRTVRFWKGEVFVWTGSVGNLVKVVGGDLVVLQPHVKRTRFNREVVPRVLGLFSEQHREVVLKGFTLVLRKEEVPSPVWKATQ